MVQIQIISDLHLESSKGYDAYEVVPKAPYLALLGDIGVAKKHKDEYLDFLSRQLQQFQAVLLVLGNHEAYGSSWPEALDVMKQFEHQQRGKPGQGEFILLDRGIFEVPSSQNGKTIILGCSLFSRVPSDRAMDVELRLADFFRTTSWTVASHNEAHAKDLAWLNAQVRQLEHDTSVVKVVIFSHWNPTRDPRAADPRHANSPITSGFATDLSQHACTTSSKVALWAFGHTHYNCDFTVDRGDGSSIRYYTNQRGYSFSPAPGFESERMVDI